MNDGKYLMSLEDHNYTVFVSTLLEGQYPSKISKQYICIPLHFPIPIDNEMFKNCVFQPIE